MKTTKELIERISPRYKKVRNDKLNFLWEDFLQSVEKVIAKLSDEDLAATNGITIEYFTNKGDTNIYRSRIAQCYFFEDLTVEYEEKDFCLGTREMLEIAFLDFRDKAQKDKYISTDSFEVEEFRFDEDGYNRITLDFILPKEL